MPFTVGGRYEGGMGDTDRAAWKAAKQQEREAEKAAKDAKRAAKRQEKDEKRGLLRQDADAAKERVANVRSHVKEHRGDRLATIAVGTKVLSLFPDRIIRLPIIGPPLLDGTNYDDMMRPIEGVEAELVESGSVSSRSTLTRTLVPGAHGWQKKMDNRDFRLVTTGSNFEWTIKVQGTGPGGSMLVGQARKFAAAANDVGRGGHMQTTQEMW